MYPLLETAEGCASAQPGSETNRQAWNPGSQGASRSEGRPKMMALAKPVEQTVQNRAEGLKTLGRGLQETERELIGLSDVLWKVLLGVFTDLLEHLKNVILITEPSSKQLLCSLIT